MSAMDSHRLIRRALDETPVIDPHCHLRPEKPAADNLADIVLYHHVWIELISAGMGQHEVTVAGVPHELADPGMEPEERVRRCLPHLPEIRNTTLGSFLRRILADLYGLEGDLDERSLGRMCRLVEERGRDPGWQEELLERRCGVERLVTVGEGRPYSPLVVQGRELSAISLLSGKQAPREVLADLERQLGGEVRSARDYREGLCRAVTALDTARLRFVGLWVPPCLSPELAAERDVDATIRAARSARPLSPAQAGGFSFFAVSAVLDALAATPLRTIQLIAGAEVLPPHRAITHWDGELVGALGRIAGSHEEFSFNVSSASDHYTQDLAILAKHVANISVAGYWWHTLYPFYVRKAIETRIDMVPMNKICAFFSDAYHAEWIYPKLALVKELWAEVLTDRCARGWCDVDTALRMVRLAFRDNPQRIYRLRD